eukprot:TRINITY_DN25687_c0_g1_i3.p1 TRINITY_DN25687_c0_g1~~TRINITY_DN25687_c0_g1_i3.p1  ORF type:complete len:264 (-),score=45.91 TRINITY_DN25687_c0_g1_i3:185-976(-)
MRWQQQLRDAGSVLHTDLRRHAFGVIDSSFPAFLNESECQRHSLPCNWFVTKDDMNEDSKRCGHSSQPCYAMASSHREPVPWWIASLVTFLLTLVVVVLFLRYGARSSSNFPSKYALSRWRKPPYRDISEDWLCSICLAEAVRGEECLLLPCGHQLHHDCMLHWLNRKDSCPMCRMAFKLDECEVFLPKVIDIDADAAADIDVRPFSTPSRSTSVTSACEAARLPLALPRPSDGALPSLESAGDDSEHPGGADIPGRVPLDIY